MGWFGSTYDDFVLAPVTGAATLVAGTVTVNDANVKANSAILLWTKTTGGTAGALFVTTKTAGTSFVIKSTSSTDTSVVGYAILNITD